LPNFEDDLLSPDKSHVIPLSDALEELNSVLAIIDGNTRGGSPRTVAGVNVLGSRKFQPAGLHRVQGNAAEDTLLYVVVFEGDNGCAVLAADDRISESVIAITDKEVLFSDNNVFELYDSRIDYNDPDLNGFQIYNAEEDDWYVSGMNGIIEGGIFFFL
jgi:hypothetical protein